MTTLIYRTASEVNDAMIRVYNNMFLAVVNSMIVAMLVSSSMTLMQFLFTGVTKWLVIFAPLVMVFFIGARMQSMSRSQAQLALHAFAALMGLSLSSIFVMFTATSITTAFMGAAALFGTMSVYGWFTRRDLTSLGQFMFVGLIAIVIASVINVFVGNGTASMVISALAIIIFLGLTAWDTQRIRETVSQDGYDGNSEIVGALSLYLNFINIFTSLLNLFGERE